MGTQEWEDRVEAAFMAVHDAVTEPYRETLALIAQGCENYTSGTCKSHGRARGAHDAADAWCYPCVAADALGRI